MHILLEKAKVYSCFGNPETPVGFTFDNDIGFWCNNADGSAYINSKDPNPPASKKFDIETGEDQKGE